MRILVFLVSLGLVACSSVPVSSPPATPQAVTFVLTPALRPLTSTLHDCVAAQPGISLYLEERSVFSLNSAGEEIYLRLGYLPEAGYAVQLGWEQLAVIVNTANPVSSLSTDELHGLFGGQLERWEVLGGEGGAVQVWVYAAGEDIRQTFDAVVLGDNPVATYAMLAPDPQAMLEAVSDNPSAIGYLPESWLVANPLFTQVQVVQLDPAIERSLRQPVLALASTQPSESTRSLLSCLY
jgi:hypothetical protein